MISTAVRDTAAEAAGDAVSGDGYTRIGDMAKQFGVTLRALRFYEDKGLLMPKREGSARLYTQRDKARLKLVLLGRRVGFSLRDVKQMIDLYEPGGDNARQHRVVLERSERQMKRLQRQRDAIDAAIAELGEMIRDLRARV
ncbi:MerR family DNA-binding transcriptional regulator [Aquibium sp. A9E412]|uniref:MerR family transcriptional regulator n=1 Tax=Aquibium sp. A9E412 TaxID=2976767 RepID=UPI0025B23657|nr:MerR family DNA-binding transcriptional regulator [Aquibium sp. A9E412]MDN2567786.1 MerR family DNA-binding transcriptional regulator [Aquibium sp. A9E412]